MAAASSSVSAHCAYSLAFAMAYQSPRSSSTGRDEPAVMASRSVKRFSARGRKKTMVSPGPVNVFTAANISCEVADDGPSMARG